MTKKIKSDKKSSSQAASFLNRPPCVAADQSRKRKLNYFLRLPPTKLAALWQITILFPLEWFENNLILFSCLLPNNCHSMPMFLWIYGPPLSAKRSSWQFNISIIIIFNAWCLSIAIKLSQLYVLLIYGYIQISNGNGYLLDIQEKY